MKLFFLIQTTWHLTVTKEPLTEIHLAAVECHHCRCHLLWATLEARTTFFPLRGGGAGLGECPTWTAYFYVLFAFTGLKKPPHTKCMGGWYVCHINDSDHGAFAFDNYWLAGIEEWECRVNVILVRSTELCKIYQGFMFKYEVKSWEDITAIPKSVLLPYFLECNVPVDHNLNFATNSANCQQERKMAMQSAVNNFRKTTIPHQTIYDHQGWTHHGWAGATDSQ